MVGTIPLHAPAPGPWGLQSSLLQSGLLTPRVSPHPGMSPLCLTPAGIMGPPLSPKTPPAPAKMGRVLWSRLPACSPLGSGTQGRGLWRGWLLFGGRGLGSVLEYQEWPHRAQTPGQPAASVLPTQNTQASESPTIGAKFLSWGPGR